LEHRLNEIGNALRDLATFEVPVGLLGTPGSRMVPVPEILSGRIPEILSGLRKEAGDENRERRGV
jgi:hypothetical protein